MASITASSVAVRAVAGRSTFLSGSSRVSAVAPRAVVKRSVVVRAEGEEPAEAPKAVVKAAPRSKDDVYLMGVSDQNMTYLDGSLPGDFGFDPLGLSDPEGAGGFVNPRWLAYSEILGGAGLIPESTGLVWFKSGAIPPQGTFDYWADPVTIFWVNMVLMNFAEVKRGQDYWNPGSQAETPLMGWESGFAGSGNPAYPGGKFFNFAGLGKDDMATMQKKEIKNGRLAMMAFLGCMVQAAVTGEGPWKNICDHVAAPFSANMLTYFGAGSGASPF